MVQLAFTWMALRGQNSMCPSALLRPDGSSQFRATRRRPDIGRGCLISSTDETTKVLERVVGPERQLRHYHVIENTVGNPQGYRDDLFRSRRRALEVARSRAHCYAAYKRRSGAWSAKRLLRASSCCLSCIGER